MPAGITHPVLGYAAFGAVKLAGYALAARFVSRTYGTPERSAWAVGAARTGIGIAAGAACSGVVWLLPPLAREAGWIFFAGLLPVRILEWWLLLWLFYDRKLEHNARGWRVVALATVWSYVVDIPALAGLFLTGGFWIC